MVTTTAIGGLVLSVSAGVIAMHNAGVPAVLLMVQMSALLAGLTLMMLTAGRLGARLRTVLRATLPGVVGLLALPLALPTAEGPARWLPAGVHVGWVVLPTVTVVVVRRIAASDRPTTWVLAWVILVVLALQPDPSTGWAFAVALCALIGLGRRATWRLVVSLGIGGLSVTAALLRNTPLPAVAHVEGIFQLASDVHPAVALCGGLGLIAVVVTPGLVATTRTGPERRGAWALFLCLGTLALAPVAGAWPVPLVGFGVSPIVGISLGLGLVCHRPRPRLDGIH